MEADVRFWIPSGLWDGDQPMRIKGACHQDDEAKEPEERWGGSCNGRLAPLPLGLDAKEGAAFFKRDFQRPAFDKGTDDGRCGLVAKKAHVGRLPVGSRTRTHRIGKGVVPVVYQRAVPLVQSIRVVVPAYQGTRLRCQRVVACVATTVRLGKRPPTTGGRPRRLVTGRTGGSKSRASRRKGAIKVT